MTLNDFGGRVIKIFYLMFRKRTSAKGRTKTLLYNNLIHNTASNCKYTVLVMNFWLQMRYHCGFHGAISLQLRPLQSPKFGWYRQVTKDRSVSMTVVSRGAHLRNINFTVVSVDLQLQ